jgi:hypothetical protein
LFGTSNAQGRSLGKQLYDQIQKEERLLLIDEDLKESEVTIGISNVIRNEVKKTIES